LYKKYTYL
jgi:hypothetical protein